MVGLSRPYPFKLFKGCLPQILLGPSLHTLSYLFFLLTRHNSTDSHSQDYSIFLDFFTLVITCKTHYFFKKKSYDQIDRVTLGSRLATAFANLCIIHQKKT